MSAANHTAEYPCGCRADAGTVTHRCAAHDPAAELRLLREVERTARAIRDWGIEHDDLRLGHLTVQVDRADVRELDAALAAVERWRRA